MIRKIGEYTYHLEDGVKEIGDWIISKHQIDEQIGESDKFMNGVFNKPFDIGIGQCRLETYFNPPILVADNIVLAGDALQKGTYKIIRTDNPNIPMGWDDLLSQEDFIFEQI